MPLTLIQVLTNLSMFNASCVESWFIDHTNEFFMSNNEFGIYIIELDKNTGTIWKYFV